MIRNKMKFYEIGIANYAFAGIVGGEGPHVLAYEGGKEYEPRGGAPLGDTTAIENYRGDRRNEAGWWICKTPTQPRIFIQSLSPEERVQLAKAFGMPIEGKGNKGGFHKSPAWQGLKLWVAEKPKLARQFGKGDVFVAWYQRILAENAGIPYEDGMDLRATG